jgi:small nuclear ribonucleoprotein (snRNP)-like protein
MGTLVAYDAHMFLIIKLVPKKGKSIDNHFVIIFECADAKDCRK